MTERRVASAFLRAYRNFAADHAMRLAASVAFAALFALAPLLIVIIAIGGAILAPSNGGHAHHVVENAILEQVSRSAGPGVAQTVQGLIGAAFDRPREGALAQAIGWITFAFGASALFAALQDALNAIWQIEATKARWPRMLRDRLASFALVVVLGVLLVLALVANGVSNVATAHLVALVPFAGGTLALRVASWIVSFAVTTIVFALVYKVLPDVALRWRDVWRGAAVTAGLFLAGQLAIGLYLTYAAVASAYGAAGSILAALVWIYYSAAIFLFGAEFTKVTAGEAHTTVAASLRFVVDRPAGTDPRADGGEGVSASRGGRVV